MSPILQTERLYLRALDLEDAAFILELVNSPGWLKYIGYRNINTIEDAQNYLLDGPLKSYSMNGFGLWCIVLKESNAPIGMCGLLKREYLDHPDLGYAILPPYEGLGYTTEITKATLAYIVEILKINTIMAITNVDHVRSIRVLEKNAFVFERFMNMPGEDKPIRLFRLINKS